MASHSYKVTFIAHQNKKTPEGMPVLIDVQRTKKIENVHIVVEDGSLIKLLDSEENPLFALPPENVVNIEQLTN